MKSGPKFQALDKALEQNFEFSRLEVGVLVISDLLHVKIEVAEDLLLVEDSINERTRVVLGGKTMQAAGEFFEQVVESTKMLLSEGRVGVSGITMFVHLIQQTTEC